MKARVRVTVHAQMQWPAPAETMEEVVRRSLADDKAAAIAYTFRDEIERRVLAELERLDATNLPQDKKEGR